MTKLSKEELSSCLEEWRNVARAELANLWIEEDEQAYQQIKKMIQKPGVTEEWIEEKAMSLVIIAGLSQRNIYMSARFKQIKDSIRSLVKEISSQQYTKSGG